MKQGPTDREWGQFTAQVTGIAAHVKAIDTKLDKSFVTKSEFNPVRNIVFGGVGVVLMSVLGALVALVVRGI